jgi:hypothetical protein
MAKSKDHEALDALGARLDASQRERDVQRTEALTATEAINYARAHGVPEHVTPDALSDELDTTIGE